MGRLPFALNRTLPFGTLFFGMLLLGNVGCVGLNIPSGRHHDPSLAASGEIQPGGPRRLDHALFFAKPSAGMGLGSTSHCLGSPGAEPLADETSDKSLPAVPWPRFHPVPTGPAFAGPR